ncbi:ribosomal RNA small subunit methyltransferase G [Rhodococcoides trifolii]|uniref:Ribosomal RNA small subunit methyltransferase G n=1 Tax=Rhodococcoides trifolii TaxID=908250 RepID=A0A917CL63_9NOCA|nr:ribosomal RNA small subunit methyltransferase G [Rhodococcus trifolii]
MEHTQSEFDRSEETPEMAAQIKAVFGDREGLARSYHASLATDGVERGLIGPREVTRLWERHLLNCAVVAELIPAGASVVDVGSGAGLPGIPLAIARPDLKVCLVEPLLRRTVYLVEIVDALGVEVQVVRGRAEQPGVVKEAGGADFVTSRAVAPLEKLARWSLPLIHDGGVMLALKGSTAEDEIARDAKALERLGARNVTVLRCGEGVVGSPTIVVRAERRVSAKRAAKVLHPR